MKKFFVAALILTIGSVHTAEDETNPFLDMASEFLQASLSNQNGGGGGIGGIAQVLGSLMQGDATGSGSGGNGAAQLISGIGALLQNMNQNAGQKTANGGGGFDPAMIMNVVSMFASSMNQDQARGGGRAKRSGASETPTMDAILSVATTFLANMNQNDQQKGDNDGATKSGEVGSWMELLPTVLQAVQAFTGPDMEETEKKHKDHANVLPPFLEHLHVIWDQFQHSELAQVLFAKVGLDKVFKVCTVTDLPVMLN